MQYSTRSLFGFVAAWALLVGFVALPSDFKGFLLVSSFLLAGVGCCLYTALAAQIPRWEATTLLVGWAFAFAVVILLGPLRTLFRF